MVFIRRPTTSTTTSRSGTRFRCRTGCGPGGGTYLKFPAKASEHRIVFPTGMSVTTRAPLGSDDVAYHDRAGTEIDPRFEAAEPLQVTGGPPYTRAGHLDQGCCVTGNSGLTASASQWTALRHWTSRHWARVNRPCMQRTGERSRLSAARHRCLRHHHPAVEGRQSHLFR